MTDSKEFNFGTCDFCGNELRQETVMSFNWYGNNRRQNVYCDKQCEMLDRPSYRYTPPSSTPLRVVAVILDLTEPSDVGVGEALDSEKIEADIQSLHQSFPDISKEELSVLVTYYLDDMETVRTDAKLENVEFRLEIPSEELKEIIKELKESTQ